MTAHAIPTTYAGMNFRSRLEARWAAFFDLLEWGWDYEPIDLDGYIPDFILPFARGPLLIEVKPIMWGATLGQWGGSDMRDEAPPLEDALSMLRTSSWKQSAVIVGATIGSGSLLGTYSADPSSDPAGEWRSWGGCCLVTCKGHVGIVPGPSLEAERGRDRGYCIVCGFDDRRCVLDAAHPVALWREAGNRVQWRPAR